MIYMLLSDINFRAAFNYAKVFSGEEDLESKMNTEAPKIEAPSAKTISKSKVEQTLSFEEFRIFFFAMRQYLMYCQVCREYSS